MTGEMTVMEVLDAVAERTRGIVQEAGYYTFQQAFAERAGHRTRPPAGLNMGGLRVGRLARNRGRREQPRRPGRSPP